MLYYNIIIWCNTFISCQRLYTILYLSSLQTKNNNVARWLSLFEGGGCRCLEGWLSPLRLLSSHHVLMHGRSIQFSADSGRPPKNWRPRPRRTHTFIPSLTDRPSYIEMISIPDHNRYRVAYVGTT